MPALTLLVLRAADLERTRRFYEALGLVFTEEKHGGGPVHYACALGATVLELYPRRAKTDRDDVRIGLAIANVAAAIAAALDIGGGVHRALDATGTAVLRDPDGRLVDLG